MSPRFAPTSIGAQHERQQQAEMLGVAAVAAGHPALGVTLDRSKTVLEAKGTCTTDQALALAGFHARQYALQRLPQLVWHRHSRQPGDLVDAVRPRHADDGRGDARIAQRVLQRRRRERHAVARAGLRQRRDARAGGRGPGLVRVARPALGALGQHAAAERRPVDRREPTGRGGVEQRLGRAVEQG
jgi:hypothetical protein